MCDLLFVPPFQRVANLSMNRLKDRLQEDARLSCLTTTMPVHDSSITTILASGPLPTLNMTEHPSHTTVRHHHLLIFQLGSKQLGKSNSNLPSFQTITQRFQMMEQPVIPRSSDCANDCAVFIPNNAPEVSNDGKPLVQKVVIVLTIVLMTALSLFQTMPHRFQMMEQPLFQKAVILPTTALSSFQTMTQRIQMMEQPLFQKAVIVPTSSWRWRSNDCALEWILDVTIPVQPSWQRMAAGDVRSHGLKLHYF